MTSPTHNPAYSKIIWKSPADSREKIFAHVSCGTGSSILFIGDSNIAPHQYENTIEILAQRGKVYAPTPKAYRHADQFARYLAVAQCNPSFIVTHGMGSRTITRLITDTPAVASRQIRQALTGARYSFFEPQDIYWQPIPEDTNVDVIVTYAPHIDRILHARRRFGAASLGINICRARTENEMIAAMHNDLERAGRTLARSDVDQALKGKIGES